jgi:putative peptidoglycan lipid II flippase
VSAEPTASGLLRSNVVVALGTAMSRFTGLLRVTVFGAIIGQTALADAYNAANSSPNAVYELLLGGVLSASLVPMFTRYLEQDDEESTSVVVSTALVVLTALTVVAVAAAPLIFRLWSINPSDEVDADQFRSVGTVLARIFLIQIFFYGVSALLGALLNSRRRFFGAAWSPVLSNVAIICSLLMVPSAMGGEAPLLGDVLDNPTLKWTLGLGATFGIALQAIILVPALKRAGIRLPFMPRWHHPAVRELATLSGWTLGFVAANQVAAIIISNVALGIGEGTQDAYVKASILFVFPHGLLAMSIATTFIPEMARSVARRDRPGFISKASTGIRLVALVTVPAAFGFFVLRRPIVAALLQYGEFTAEDVLVTSRALGGLSLGLIGFSIYLFVLRGFYAHRDTRTPFILSVGQNLLNIVFAIALYGRYDVLGLGLAYGLSYLIAAAWAMAVLRNKVPGFDTRSIYWSIGRMVLAAVVMAEIVYFAARWMGGNEGLGAFMAIGVCAVIGGGVYAGLLVLLKAPELDQLTSRFRRA